MVTKKHMKTAATLPAIAKALDQVFTRLDRMSIRLDLIEERQVEFAKVQRQILRRLRKLEHEVAEIHKTLDRLIDFTADLKFNAEETAQAVSRLRERSEKTFDHFDVLVDLTDKQRHELAALHKRQDHLETKAAALAR